MRKRTFAALAAACSLLTPFHALAEELPVNPYREVINNMTDEELDLIQKNTWAEANNQCMDGQRAVIEVILNRVLSDEFPDTVYGVLSQRGQFATWKSRNKVKLHPEQADALLLVYEESPILPDTGYLYFSRGKFGWCHHNIRIEDHIFGKV